ncbi:Exosome complex component RRP45B [Camellia lanceoleosa]|uniref:Exosome complex component RRP45B n=1 Tax=Camellia lanceoleosa TaxID=1840588 RepID=A0ACC0FNI8_9ERIC|nr:Exosome complex component RRP45B [Camellia lanceoleosa]
MKRTRRRRRGGQAMEKTMGKRREDGSSEVQLGQTHVMGFVTSQLVQPYRDRPNEGSLSIFTEFSPMVDPSFSSRLEKLELGRIIDRGLRESRAVDMESLCVIAGKLVWAIRLDLHILDNGGNLVDTANIAALAALMTFRRPECTLGGEDGHEVIIHQPEVREPLPLIIHHLPIAVTFGFFGNDNIVVIDSTHNEEAVMSGRMIATLNTNGDVCAIQKAGGAGVMQSVIMQCLRIASVKAADVTSKIKNAVESYNTERALRKIKRHSSSAALDVNEPGAKLVTKNQSVDQKGVGDLLGRHVERLKLITEESGVSQEDPYSKGIDPDALKTSLAARALTSSKKLEESRHEKPSETEPDQLVDDVKPAPSPDGEVGTGGQTNGKKTLIDAVKPKHKRKKKSSSNVDANSAGLKLVVSLVEGDVRLLVLCGVVLLLFICVVGTGFLLVGSWSVCCMSADFRRMYVGQVGMQQHNAFVKLVCKAPEDALVKLENYSWAAAIVGSFSRTAYLYIAFA